MEICKPDMYVTLSDGETNTESGYKRSHNSAAFTSEMFKRCLEKHQSSSASILFFHIKFYPKMRVKSD